MASMNSLIDSATQTQSLEQGLKTTYRFLTAFATAEDFIAKMTLSFGNNFKAEVVEALAQDWARGDFTALPKIEIRSAVEINGAMGAFAKATNTIYLSPEYLGQNAGNPEAVASVLLEEVGHYVDARVNDFEAPGDEGAIFSALVRGESLSTQQLQLLKAEDDFATITLDGQTIQIEQASYTGTDGNDTLPGSGNDNSGDDTFDPLLGRDKIDGGAGNDLLVVDYSTNTYPGARFKPGIRTTVGKSSTEGFYGSFSAYKDDQGRYDQVTFNHIDRFRITGTNQADKIRGASGDDILNGGDGNDTLTGGLGIDTLNGGGGDDLISGGGGSNVIDGGEGVDTFSDADFSTAIAALTFDDTGTAHAPITLANGTSVTGVEYFEGLQTGSGN